MLLEGERLEIVLIELRESEQDDEDECGKFEKREN